MLTISSLLAVIRRDVLAVGRHAPLADLNSFWPVLFLLFSLYRTINAQTDFSIRSGPVSRSRTASFSP